MLTRLKHLISAGPTKPPGQFEAPPCPEQTIYAIGDIHGCIDLLEALLAAIDADILKCREESPVLVLLGDYVDRGENAAKTLQRVKDLAHSHPQNVICLMGNHEKMLLDFLDDPVQNGWQWMRNGGLQTLASYRVGGVSEQPAQKQLLNGRDALQSAIPTGIEDWLRGLPLTWQSGNMIFVHAALDPVKDVDTQDSDTLLWGHRDFRKLPRTDGNWVVHGHTIVEQPTNHDGCISIDTGAYFSGRLSAAKIDDTGVQFISN